MEKRKVQAFLSVHSRSLAKTAPSIQGLIATGFQIRVGSSVSQVFPFNRAFLMGVEETCR